MLYVKQLCYIIDMEAGMKNYRKDIKRLIKAHPVREAKKQWMGKWAFYSKREKRMASQLFDLVVSVELMS